MPMQRRVELLAALVVGGFHHLSQQLQHVRALCVAVEFRQCHGAVGLQFRDAFTQAIAASTLDLAFEPGDIDTQLIELRQLV